MPAWGGPLLEVASNEGLGLTRHVRCIVFSVKVLIFVEALHKQNLGYVQSVILLPALSVNEPTTIMMKSTSIQMPSPPKVSTCKIPVPILPT